MGGYFRKRNLIKNKKKVSYKLRTKNNPIPKKQNNVHQQRLTSIFKNRKTPRVGKQKVSRNNQLVIILKIMAKRLKQKLHSMTSTTILSSKQPMTKTNSFTKRRVIVHSAKQACMNYACEGSKPEMAKISEFNKVIIISRIKSHKAIKNYHFH